MPRSVLQRGALSLRELSGGSLCMWKWRRMTRIESLGLSRSSITRMLRRSSLEASSTTDLDLMSICKGNHSSEKLASPMGRASDSLPDSCHRYGVRHEYATISSNIGLLGFCTECCWLATDALTVLASSIPPVSLPYREARTLSAQRKLHNCHEQEKITIRIDHEPCCQSLTT